MNTKPTGFSPWAWIRQFPSIHPFRTPFPRMRLLRLDLIAFGPFTGAAFDFASPGDTAAGGSPGLHLLYGPNEAGKTTARRSLRLALYGFPHKVEHAFRHAATDLRIGMTLEGPRGEPVAFVRRRGNKNTLLAADGQAALTDDPVAPLLSAAGSADDFERMFAIGETELRAGGAALVGEKGGLSETLFMTAAGLPRLRAVERALAEQAESLYLPTGKKPAINDALARWKERKAAAAEKSLPAAEHDRHADALRAATAERDAVEGELGTLRNRLARLTRLKQAQPTAVRYRQRTADLAAVADAPSLPDDFPETRRRHETGLQVAAAALKRAEGERQAVERELAGLAVPDDLLAGAAEIERLFRRLGVHEKAAADTAVLQTRIATFAAAARATLRSVRPGLDLEAAESLRLTAPDRAAIDELDERRRELLAGRKAVDVRLRQLRDDAAAAEAELAALGPDVPTDALRDAVRRAEREADLDVRLADARGEADRLGRQVSAARAALTLWDGAADVLAALPVPPAATIDRFETEFARFAQEADRLATRRDAAERGSRTADHDLGRVGEAGAVPTEDALRGARDRRDALWREIRRDLAGQPPGPDRPSLLVDDPDLPPAFEAANRTADEAADRLRREAQRVERFQSLTADRNRFRDELAEATQAEADLGRRRDAVQAEWAALWPFLPTGPRTPREMREWSVRREALVELSERLRTPTQRADELAGRLAERRGELAAVLEVAKTSAPSLARLVEAASRLRDERDATAARRRELRTAIERIGEEARRIERDALEEREELGELRRRWATRMTRLGLAADAAPREAQAFLAATAELFENLDQAAGLRDRVLAMEADAASFAADVRGAAERFATDLIDSDPAPAAAALHARLMEAKSLRDARRALEARGKTLAADAQKAEGDRVRLDAELAALCRQAGCGDPAKLPAVEGRSARRRKLEQDADDAERELALRSGGRPVPEFLAELDGVDADAIDADLERLSAEVERLDARGKALNLEIGAADAQLRAMKGGADAAHETEQAEAVLAEIAANVERYVRLRLAARLLRDGRERYRRSTGNATLDHASRLFAGLTCGRYAGLAVEFGENDEPTLLGVAADKGDGAGVAKVPPDAMSDGAADQLYLALRLAGLHAWLDKHEPLPFVVDDLLIHFDDDRAAAALRALAELSRRTQVLFFTHHRHLVDLAAASTARGVVPRPPPAEPPGRDVRSKRARRPNRLPRSRRPPRPAATGGSGP